MLVSSEIMNKTEKKDTSYNGWKNRQTWNVMLWINNEEPLYRAAVEFMSTYKGRCPYASFIKWMGMEDERTPNNIKWISDAVSFSECNAAMYDLRSC